jgi:hypothetical protein
VAGLANESVGVRPERLIGRARVVVVVVVVVRCTYFEQNRAVNDDTGAMRWQVRSTKR